MMQNDDQHSYKEFWKCAGYIILSLIVLILFVQLLINTVAEPKLQQKIESALAGKSQYITAKIENLDISLLKRQIRFENVILFPEDSLQSPHKSPLFVDSLSVPIVTVSGIQIWPFLFDNDVKIHSVSISEPFLKGIKRGGISSKENKKKNNKSLYERISSFADVLKIDDFSLEGFSALITDSSGDQIGNLEKFNVHFSNIRVDSSSPHRNLLPVSVFSGSADSISWKTSSRLYRISAGNIFFSTENSLFEVNSFRVKPIYPKYQFSQIVGHETDRINLHSETIEFTGFDLTALVEKNELIASRVKTINSNLEVFRNKKMPFGNKKKRVFPHLRFRRLQMPVKVDSIILKNTDITYIEHKKGVPKPGTVTFENTEAIIKSVDNTDQKGITMNASTRVMGVGLMKVDFSFPHNPSGTHYINGSVGSMKMEKLNPVLKYLALSQITSGRIDSIDFKMELGPLRSNGILRMDYSNLHIKMVDFAADGNKNEDPIKTFLSNLFVIDEKDKPPLRVAEISFERILYRSIFNYWWKSLLSGLKNSIGA